MTDPRQSVCRESKKLVMTRMPVVMGWKKGLMAESSDQNMFFRTSLATNISIGAVSRSVIAKKTREILIRKSS